MCCGRNTLQGLEDLTGLLALPSIDPQTVVPFVHNENVLRFVRLSCELLAVGKFS